MLFTNLPLRYIHATSTYLDFFLRQNLSPELGIDALALDSLPRTWHTHIAAIFHQAGLTCAVHLPFMDLHPGSSDPQVRQVCVDRLRQAIDIALIYQPAHCVAHLDFVEWISRSRADAWLDLSVATWTAVLGHLGAVPLFLENVCEQEPHRVASVLTALHGRARMCFDLGHWYSFGGGYARDNLEQWLAELGPWIGHVHLHDNDGSADQHRGLGRGGIPWTRIEHFLRARPDISATIEPHTLEDFQATYAYLTAHSGFGQAVGLVPTI